MMWGLISISIFILLLSFPGFYLITRKVFPRSSKRSAAWISAAVTAVFLAMILAMMLGMLM